MRIKEIEKLVRPLYVKKDGMHNFSHIVRIKKKLKFLKKNYKKINEQRLNFLLYFHGLKDWVEKNKKKILSLGFTEADINSLTRHAKNPRTVEEKLVYDANALENVGKFGIKKLFIVGEKLGRSKKESIEFLRKNLNKIKFYTSVGKELGNKGIKIMKDFVRLNT